MTTDPYRYDAHPAAAPAGSPATPVPVVFHSAPKADVAPTPIASIGRRVLALFLDTLLISVISMIIIAATGGFSAGDSKIAFDATGLTAVLVWLIGPTYWVAMEATGGATLGKRLLRLRVVRRDDRGAADGIGFGRAIARYLLLIVDTFAIGLVGLLTATISRENRRVGDHVAGTVVVQLP